ncbi:MAG: GAF domain-containing protein [Candidatus Nanopelagicales bacterium]|jgi:methyl-accepting chemotaxis protein
MTSTPGLDPALRPDAEGAHSRAAALPGPDDSTWSGRRAAREAERAFRRTSPSSVVEAFPLRVMAQDRNQVIRYMNAPAKQEMGALVASLGLSADDLIGLPVEILSRTPGYVDADPRRHELPYTFEVDNGQDLLEVTVSAIVEDGERVGALTTWQSIEDRKTTARVIADVAADNQAVDLLLRSLEGARTPVDAAMCAIESLRSSLRFDLGAFWVLADDGTTIVQADETGVPDETWRTATADHRFRIGHGPVGQAWAARDLVVVDDLAQAECPRSAAAAVAGYRSAVCLPVIVAADVVGVIEVVSREVREIRNQRRATLRNLAQLVSHAISRMLSEQAAAETAKDTATVADLLSSLVGVSTSEEAAAVALSVVRTHLGFDYGTCWTLVAGTDRMRFLLDSGTAHPEFVRATHEQLFAEGEGLVGAAWRRRDVVALDDASVDRAVARRAAAEAAGIRSGVAFPVTVDGEVRGVMDFAAAGAVALTEARLETLRTISRLLSQTFSRLALEERERSVSRRLQNDVEEILAVVRAAAEGDLTQRLEVSSDGSIRIMGDGLDEFFGRLRASLSEIAGTAHSLGSAGMELESVSSLLIENATSTSDQVEHLSLAASDVALNVESVAGAADQLRASIAEIATSASTAAGVANQAVAVAGQANDSVMMLNESSAEIGKVIRTITSIADQTNLLALNATIEAARAGDAGKGFAVVANEVKELAKETAGATQEISRRIAAIQESTLVAMDAITEIADVITRINSHQEAISSAVEEQTATTTAIAYNVSAAATGALSISEGLRTVGLAADSTRTCALDSERAAGGLVSMSTEMQRMLRQFRF